MAKIVQSLDTDLDEVITCSSCGWSGRIGDNMEVYSEVADVTCVCGRMLLIMQFPTIDEVKKAAAEGNPKARRELQHFLKIERYAERFQELKLKGHRRAAGSRRRPTRVQLGLRR